MIVRLWCRLVGHKWVFVPGVSHGHDELYECRRCGGYEWRDAPAQDDAAPGTAGAARHPAGASTAGSVTNDEGNKGRPAAAGQPARFSRR